jgi:hypothetical protein
MKITKRQLRKIIREALTPGYQREDPHIDDEPFIRQMEQALNDLSDEGATNADLIDVCKQMIADIEKGFIGQPT